MTAKTKTAAKNIALNATKTSALTAPASRMLPAAIDVTVPLNKLVLSPRNVRKGCTDEGVPELAAHRSGSCTGCP